jgi:glycosyltransferase involved in cell wall biosynthesis
VGCPAEYLRDKAEGLYKLAHRPVFLPNIEHIPERVPEKTGTPEVVFVGRLDSIKRPERFIVLASHFREIRFTVIGRANSRKRQAYLEALAAKYPNVVMAGFLDKFSSPEFGEILSRASVLVNTSGKESLPVSFVEAAARGCAILSRVDPDGFASRFGCVVDSDDYESGLAYLLEDERFRELGRKAHAYVYDKYRFNRAIEAHIAMYEQLLDDGQYTA